MTDSTSTDNESQATTPVAAPGSMNWSSSLDSNVSSHQGPLDETEEGSAASSDWDSNDDDELSHGKASETDDSVPIPDFENVVPPLDDSKKDGMEQQQQIQEQEQEQMPKEVKKGPVQGQQLEKEQEQMHKEVKKGPVQGQQLEQEQEQMHKEVKKGPVQGQQLEQEQEQMHKEVKKGPVQGQQLEQEQELKQKDPMRILLDSNFQDDLNKCLNYHDEFKNTPVAEQMHTIMRMSEKIARFVQQFQSQYGAIFLTNTTSPGVMGKYQDHVSVMCHCAKVLTSTMANRAGAWEKELENASTEAKYDSEEVFEQIQRIEEDQRIRKREEMARDERQKQREEEIKRLEWDLEFKHASIDAAEKKVKKAEEKVQQAEARVQKTEKDIKIEVERRVEAVREETIREAAEIVLRELAEEEIEDAHHGPSHSAAPTSAEELTSPRSVTPRSLGRISAGARKAKEKIAELRKENRNIVYEKGQLEERLQEGKAKQEVWNKTEREYKRQIKLKQTQIDRKQIDIQALQANMQAKEKGYDALQEKYMADREKLEQAYNALRDQVDSDEAKRILAARKRQDEKQANTNKASAPPRGSPPQTRQKDPDAPQLHDRSTSASPQLAADSNFSLANELGEDWETFGTSSLVDEPLDGGGRDSYFSRPKAPPPEISSPQASSPKAPSPQAPSPKEASQKIPSAAGRWWTTKLFSTSSAGYHLQAWIDVICWLVLFLWKLLHSLYVFVYKQILPLLFSFFSSIFSFIYSSILSPIFSPIFSFIYSSILSPIFSPIFSCIAAIITFRPYLPHVVVTALVHEFSVFIDSIPFSLVRLHEPRIFHMDQTSSPWAARTRMSWVYRCLRLRNLMPGLNRVKWEKRLRVQSYPEIPPFPMEAATRIIRQMLVFFTMHTYMACHEEKNLWLKANGQTREYLIWQIQGHIAFWVIPGVNPSLPWGKGRKAWTTFLMLTSDWLFSLVQELYWWRV